MLTLVVSKQRCTGEGGLEEMVVRKDEAGRVVDMTAAPLSAHRKYSGIGYYGKRKNCNFAFVVGSIDRESKAPCVMMIAQWPDKRIS